MRLCLKWKNGQYNPCYPYVLDVYFQWVLPKHLSGLVFESDIISVDRYAYLSGLVFESRTIPVGRYAYLPNNVLEQRRSNWHTC